jgi:iron(III) transport system permease protein
MRRRPSLTLTWYIWFGLLVATFAAICLGDPRVARLWVNSAILAAGTGIIAIPLGTLAALLIVKTSAPGRRWTAIMIAGMLLVPLFLIAGAWDAGFGVQGWYTLRTNPHLATQPLLSGWRAAIWIHGLAAVPWVALIVGVGLLSVERELEEDALLVMSPPQVLWHVTLPRIRPAIAVAALWVAIIATIEISVTDFFQVRTFAEEVYTQAALGAALFSGESTNLASTAAWWLGLVLFGLLAAAGVLTARHALRDFGNISVHNTWSWQLRAARWPAAALLGLLVLLVAGLPLLNLLYKAGGMVAQTEFGRERSWSLISALMRVAAAPQEFADDLWLSAWVAAAAATSCVLISLPLAWSLRLARGKPIARVLALALCWTIPGPVLGIAVIRMFNQPIDSPLEFLGALYDSYFPTWLVQTVRGLPLTTLILWAAFTSVPHTLLETATLDGAGWWRKLARVALPLRWPAISVAWLIAFAIAVGELPATVLVLPPGRATAITVRIFQLLHYGADERVAAISLVMVFGTMLLALVTAAILRRAAITAPRPPRPAPQRLPATNP